jgi:hypothetical protein
MQITCAGCKSAYNLTLDQIKGLPYSILPCKHCSRNIKISSCPHCNSFYSITFTSTQQSKYQLTCERCSKPFIIDFPLIKEAHKIGEAKKAKKASPEKPPFFEKFKKKKAVKPTPTPAPAPRERRPEPGIETRAPSSRAVSFSLGDLLSLCGTAFTIPKLTAAALGIIASFMLVLGYNYIMGLALAAGYIVINEYVKSILTIIPFAIIFFLYIMAASVIARITMDAMAHDRDTAPGRAARFLLRAVAPIFLANIILFIAVDLVFLLFGRIPVIGPVLFALLFLPVYVLSLCVVILLAIGFWFYPAVIAGSAPGAMAPIRGLLRFIRRQNFRLAYTIPLMTIITAVTFAAIYLIHYGSFALTMFLAKNVLSEEGDKIFSAIPPTLLQISDLTLMGSDTGLFKSLLKNLLLEHTIGGFIIGVVFSLISITLFASFVSISATLSTHFYVMMEKDSDMDDSSKIRILLLLVLALAGVFLVKKIFF